MNVVTAIAQLTACANPDTAPKLAAYHKAERRYLGTPTPEIDALAKSWRGDLDLAGRLALAANLWDSNIHEARIAAAKLLTQARIRPEDSTAWDLLCTWVPQFDAWAIADAASVAIAKRLAADPARLDTAEIWTHSPLMWQRRTALVATLPFARLNHPKPAEAAARERTLLWAASFLNDKDWFIQKAVATWLRDLSKHDPARTQSFLNEYGDLMKPWVRKEAGQYLP
jgi:3-methyladenine DNA glycosylase AlkD